MNTRNQTQQQQPKAKPASASSKASGFYTVGRYRTVSGKIGAEIRVSAASGRFMYTGAWGAGSGLSRESMVSSLRIMLRGRRGVVDEIPFGGLEVAR
ncbi:hypothetical protein [Xanthomonas axonopodis]|uniref:hypothetical protein n=1 Tax=Xanthomonas axonopodis TaxID=53413 RepID=UPI003557C76E